MFIVKLHYVKPLEDVDRWLSEHAQFLDKYYAENKLIFSGRLHPRTGGVFLANVKSRAEVEQMISEDPFHRNHVAEYEVIEFQPTKYAAGFAPFVEPV